MRSIVTTVYMWLISKKLWLYINKSLILFKNGSFLEMYGTKVHIQSLSDVCLCIQVELCGEFCCLC